MIGLRPGDAFRNLLLLGFPAVIALSTLVAVAMLYFPAPQADYWDHINWLRRLQISEFTFTDLFRQANEHRIVIPRLIFLLDDALIASTGVICIAVIMATAAALAALFAWVGGRELEGDGGKYIFFLSISFCLLFNQYENFLWENQVQFLFVYVFAAFGAYLAITEVDNDGTPRPWRHAAAIALLVAAAYSMANGVLIFIALFICFLMVRRHRAAAAYLAVGAVVLAAYLYGYHRPGYHPDPVGAIHKLTLVLLHFQITMTGLFAGTGIAAASPAGTVLVGLPVGYLLLRMGLIAFGVHRATTGEQLFIVMAMYVLGSCLVTSLGRAELDVAQGTASRYQTPVNIFWLSILALLAYDRFLARLPGRKIGAMVLVCCLAALFAGTQWVGWRKASARALQLGTATDALIVGVPDNPSLIPLFPAPAVPLEFSDVLRRERRSLFADPRYDALLEQRTLAGGEPLSALGAADVMFREVSEGAYRGGMLTARVDGLAGSSAGRPVSVADQCNRLVGFGRLAVARTPQESKTRLVFKGKPGYLTAFVRSPDPDAPCGRGTGDPAHDYRLIVR